MKNKRLRLDSMPRGVLILLMMFQLTFAEDARVQSNWKRLPSLPDRQGWAGMVAGVSHQTLLAGGGANFPDAPPWEGGVKTWSDRLFALRSEDGHWIELTQKLPFRVGYSTVASFQDRIIVVGGETPVETGSGTRCSQSVFSLELMGDSVSIHELPVLPKPLSNSRGVLLDSTLYLVGGISSPTSTTAETGFYALDLNDVTATHWTTLPELPGKGRMLSVAAGTEETFYVFGGVALKAGDDGKVVREVLRDCYRYTLTDGWKRIADLPRAVTAAPSPAPVLNGRILLLGGDDGSQMGLPPTAHRGFSRQAQWYHPARDNFETAGAIPAAPVTAPVVNRSSSWFVVSGEVRPGIRSPEVWKLMDSNESSVR